MAGRAYWQGRVLLASILPGETGNQLVVVEVDQPFEIEGFWAPGFERA